jgi:hypothetical protein
MSVSLHVIDERLGPIALDGEPLRRPPFGITGPVTLPVRFGNLA